MLIKKICIFTLSLFLMYSIDAIGAYNEDIEWINDGGQILITRAQYTQMTFNDPMCIRGQRHCRLFFTSFYAGAPSSPTEGITISDSRTLTDTQYAADLAGFSGRKLPLPADQGLCIWMYSTSPGSVAYTRWNCDENGGIPPVTPVKPTCSILSPVTIDFKVLNASAVDGSVKSSNLNILCDGDTTVLVRILGTSPTSEISLREDGSLVAEVLVRNTLGNTGRPEVASANSFLMVPINARLKANGVLAGGPFKGSAIISVDIM